MRESCTEKKRGAKKRQNLEERERFSEAACRKEAERKDPGSGLVETCMSFQRKVCADKPAVQILR